MHTTKRIVSRIKAEDVHRVSWTVRNKGTGEKCGYHSNHGPVTEAHVRTSPKVLEWAAGADIDVLPKSYDCNMITRSEFCRLYARRPAMPRRLDMVVADIVRMYEKDYREWEAKMNKLLGL